MKFKSILSILVIIAFLFFIGCSAKDAVNPLDSRNQTEALDADTAESLGFSGTRTVDSDSDEGQELVHFKWGEHVGELKYLNVSIEYLDYYFTDPGGYPGYYIGLPMRYQITIENTGGRNFGHLEIIAIEEYYEDMLPAYRWWCEPFEVNIHKGDAMPGDSIQIWEDIYLGPHSEIVLEDTYTAPIQTCAGLDQTHLIIKHYNNGVLHAAVIYDNPELGVYCPPPPED